MEDCSLFVLLIKCYFMEDLKVESISKVPVRQCNGFNRLVSHFFPEFLRTHKPHMERSERSFFGRRKKTFNRKKCDVHIYYRQSCTVPKSTHVETWKSFQIYKNRLLKWCTVMHIFLLHFDQSYELNAIESRNISKSKQ
jgi:hypothetical protein